MTMRAGHRRPSGRFRPLGRLLALTLGMPLATLALGCQQVQSETKAADADGLAYPLMMREAQAGFAGVRTSTMIVEPDGQFCRARKLDAEGAGGSQRGQLDGDRLEALARAVAMHEPANLPDSHGKAPRVNGYELTFVADGKRSVFHLVPPGKDGQLSAEGDPSGAVDHAVGLRQAVIDAIDDAPSEASKLPCTLPAA